MERKFTFSPGEYYHIYNRGTDKRIIFNDHGDYQRFLSLMYLANNTEAIHISNLYNRDFTDILAIDRPDTLVEIGAYCLMTNHFHLLLHEKTDNGISLFMKKLATGYSMYFNKKYDRSGSLFQGRFKAQHADDDEYLKYLFAYIHLNPLSLINSKWKENGVKNVEEAKDYLNNYKYSSYLAYSKKPAFEHEKILHLNVFPEYFDTKASFEQLITDCLEEE